MYGDDLGRRFEQNGHSYDVNGQLWTTPVLPRFLRELDLYVALAESHSALHVRCIVTYFYATTKAGTDVDQRVTAFLERARLRYCKQDPKERSIPQALGLMRPTRGNPGGRRGRLMAMTDDELIEAAQKVFQERATGKTYDEATREVASELRISSRTLQDILQRIKGTKPPGQTGSFDEWIAGAAAALSSLPEGAADKYGADEKAILRTQQKSEAKVRAQPEGCAPALAR